MQLVSIRGATTIEDNMQQKIIHGTKQLLLEMERSNNLDRRNVVSIFFSATKDLNTEYPAKAARLLGYNQCGLMCFNEMDVIDGIDKCIRVMILYNGVSEQKKVKHIYLGKAKTLRPDLNP
ncbi:MAG: chorismate mutase [Tissierellia bacterium]|nr:chorismate mutase [Tissierellia bacterium]